MAANQNSEAAKERNARKANFTSSELAVLTEQVEENVHVLKSKVTGSVTNVKKNEIWAEITAAVKWQRGRPKKSGINEKKLTSVAKRVH